MESFLRVFINSIETGGIYALAALAIIIVYKTSVTANFSQGTVAMFNAFISTEILLKYHVSTWLSMIAGILTSILIGILIDFFIIRRAKFSGNLGILGKQIITLGLLIFFLGITPWIFGTNVLNFPRLFPDGMVMVAGTSISYNAMFNIGIGIFIMLLLFYFLQFTKWGLAVRVTASNEYTAKLMGVPTKLITMGAWAIAGGMATLAALMIAPDGTVNTSMMDQVQVTALIACVLGGFQTFYGPLIGAYLISLMSNYLQFYVSTVWGDTLTYAIILIFIVFRPNGLVAKKIVKKV